MLVVLEGLDAGGKSIELELLKKELGVSAYKYPTRNFKVLNDYLEKKIELDSRSLFHLFLADIANEQGKIKSELEKGKTVVLDRYVFSTIAYEINGINYDDAKCIVKCSRFIVPDRVLLLDLSPELAQQRKSKQKALDRYEENLTYLGKVRANFLKLYEDRFLAKDWHKVDASRSIQDVHKDILNLLNK